MVTATDAPTPTGLQPGEIRALRHAERISLAGWQESVSGNDNGRLWLPGAIRKIPIAGRLHLAEDQKVDALWRERERRRVQGSVHYFTQGYGHVLDSPDPDPDADPDDAGGGGSPIPFTFWPRVPSADAKCIGARDQEELLQLMVDELRLALLKARQLGATWIALHYAYHLQAFEPTTPNATILAMSQDGGYAKRLLERARGINELLPPFLRHPEDRETRESKTEFKLAGRGRMVSLAGTKDAPRSYQAELTLCDEWAFVRNAQAGPTMQAALPNSRQIIALSSGNGPPEEPGNGKYFARLWQRAHDGLNDWVAVFLPTSTHPARNQAFRDREIANYDSDEEYLAEHPETPGDALIGAGKDRYFRLSDVNKAIVRGAELDALLGTDEIPDPVDEGIITCGDYGDVVTAGYVIWPLEGGGFYVPPSEVVASQAEAEEIAAQMHTRVAELQDVDGRTGRINPPIVEHRFDNAGKQTNRSYMAVARKLYSHQYEASTPRSHGVRFSESKRETAGYMRRLLKRTGQGRATGIIAVSPHNPELCRQLRGLESAPDGLWKKSDDHGPDAIVAGASGIAKRNRDLTGN